LDKILLDVVGKFILSSEENDSTLRNYTWLASIPDVHAYALDTRTLNG